ncbi:hypothetical protein [uncultured Luteimonas sp.]|uniref:hypothetical protein n=1 Tax=uncultured Luteimonas sp. TaxID=453144 RepID=UPI002638C852|nr:hypothetical protein [uncultured Luteimonas sp.]
MGALVAVTGARPGGWIGDFDLDQVIADYGLVLIKDKATDPLREIRVAATGRRWLAGLRKYLDMLIRIERGALGEQMALLAGDILRAKAPLFAVMTEQGDQEVPSARYWRSLLPEELQVVPNYTRHRLNQQLTCRRVDAELRHAQLGWVVSPAFTLSDLSHWSARHMAEALASTLDEILVEDGWFPASQRTSPWRWDGVPNRSLSDWNAVDAGERARSQTELRRVKAELRARWKETEPVVLAGIAEAFRRFIPALAVDVNARKIVAGSGLGEAPAAVSLTFDHHALIYDAVRSEEKWPNDAASEVAMRIWLYRLVRRANAQGLIDGPLPRRPFLSATAQSSPFLPGLGLAVRHAEALRERLVSRADEQRANDGKAMTAWLVAAFSSIRTPELVRGVVAAASKAVRPAKRGDLLRVPAMIDGKPRPVVIGGLAAVALAQRAKAAPTGPPPPEARLGAWLKSLGLDGLPSAPLEACSRMFATLRAAGSVELSGPERIMLNEPQTAAARVERSLARDDDWPVNNLADALEAAIAKPSLYERWPGIDRGLPEDSGDQMDGYRHLVALLNPEGFGRSRRGSSDGKRGWRPELGRRLQELRERYGDRSNVGLLMGYVAHMHRHGGRRKSQLAHATLGTQLTRFGSDLLRMAGSQLIAEWDVTDFETGYLAVLYCKSDEARRQAFDALMDFHGYLINLHQVPEISEAALRKLAGERIVAPRPGMVTRMEVEQVFDALQADIAAEQVRPDALPEAVRLLLLRKLMFALLEASGIRPSSVYGLTLGDLLLAGPGRDFVRVRTTGDYGQAKSKASLGYVGLEGPLWARARQEVLTWVDQEISQVGQDRWWNLPLFASAPGARRRFGRSLLTGRIDRLLKWAVGDPRAGAYWLRKNKVTARHERICSTFQTQAVPPTARATYAVLRESGHTSMDVPLFHYISDPAVAQARELADGCRHPRRAFLSLTGISGPVMDMAWQRAGGAKSRASVGVVLGRVGMMPAAAHVENVTPAPPLKRQGQLMPRHVAAYATAMAKEDSRTDALLRCGLSEGQASNLDLHARELWRRTGYLMWQLPETQGSSAVTALPRRLLGTDRLYALLDRPATPELLQLADAWSTQGFVKRVQEGPVLMEVDDGLAPTISTWISGLDLQLEVERRTTAWVLRGAMNVPPSRSHAAAFRWVLAVVWIYTQFTDSRDLPA